MIKFDAEHKSFNKPIKTNVGKKIKNIIASGLLISSIFSLSACCNVRGDHFHKYVAEDTGMTFYLSDDYSGAKSLNFGTAIGIVNKTDDYVAVNKDEKKLYKAAEFYIKISENQKALEDWIVLNDVGPFYEYEYSYEKTGYNGATFFSQTVYFWSKDPDLKNNSTGRMRVTYPVYYGYSFEKQDDGTYLPIKSKPYPSYEAMVADGYDYVSATIQDFISFNIEYENVDSNSLDGSITK